MTSSFYLLVLSLLLLSVATTAARRSQPLLETSNAAMMTCLLLLGGATIGVSGYRIHAGSIFAGTVMYGLTLTHLMYGARQAYRSIGSILFVVVIIFGSLFLLQEAHALNPNFGTATQAIGARFVTFWLIQTFFIALLDRYSGSYSLWWIPVVTIVLQGLDSVIFFPCGFAGAMPLGEVARLAVTGWATKSAVTVLSIPFLIWVRRRIPNQGAVTT